MSVGRFFVYPKKETPRSNFIHVKEVETPILST